MKCIAMRPKRAKIIRAFSNPCQPADILFSVELQLLDDDNPALVLGRLAGGADSPRFT